MSQTKLLTDDACKNALRPLLIFPNKIIIIEAPLFAETTHMRKPFYA